MLARLDSYRKLGDTTDTVIDAFAGVGAEQKEGWTKGGEGPVWIVQEITVTWRERTTYTLQE